MEVDFDLSDVMFRATANSMDSIPLPLLDRMEIIRLPGYTEDEKIKIAKKYLLSKQFQQNGLKNKELLIATSAVKDIIRYYTAKLVSEDSTERYQKSAGKLLRIF